MVLTLIGTPCIQEVFIVVFVVRFCFPSGFFVIWLRIRIITAQLPNPWYSERYRSLHSLCSVETGAVVFTIISEYLINFIIKDNIEKGDEQNRFTYFATSPFWFSWRILMYLLSLNISRAFWWAKRWLLLLRMNQLLPIFQVSILVCWLIVIKISF